MKLKSNQPKATADQVVKDIRSVCLRSNQISAVGSQSDDASPAVAVWLGARLTGLANVASPTFTRNA